MRAFSLWLCTLRLYNLRKTAVQGGIAIGLAMLSSLSWAQPDISLYAAASLTDVLTDIARQYENNHAVKIKTSFASSSTLAKQIAAGARAEIFASADLQWMDYLDRGGKLQPNSRQSLLGNTLVLIAPQSQSISIELKKDSDIANSFSGKLCTGDPEHVPVGKYAK